MGGRVQVSTPPAANDLKDKARGSGLRNPWSDERARFLSARREESEERIELVFLAGKKERGFEDTGPSLDGDALGQDPFSSPFLDHHARHFLYDFDGGSGSDPGNIAGGVELHDI
jgi:hypothetical protein